MWKNKVKKLHTKIGLLFACFAILLGIFISIFGYKITWSQATRFYSEKASNAAALAATFVDGDRVSWYIENRQTDEAYEELRGHLSTIKKELDLFYIYVFVPGEESFTYLVEGQLEEDDPNYISTLGDEYKYTELEYRYLVPDVKAKRASQEVIVSRESLFFGSGVSTWVPVFDSKGEVAAMVEADIALDSVTASIQSSLFLMLSVYFVLIIAIILVQGVSIRRMITIPLKKLTDRTLRFAAEGELSDFKNDIETGDELQTLSEAFGTMAHDITAYTQEKADLAAVKERIATELEVASEIQQSMLPGELPEFPGKKYLDVQGQLFASKKMGGNFYDYFVLDDHHVGIVICGMPSTGIPATMLMVVTRTIIKSQFLSAKKLSGTISEINRQVYDSMDWKRPISAFIGVLDTEDGTFSYVNAGYNPPVVMRRGERYEFLASPAYTPLGVEQNVSYRELKMELRQGDRLLFYSDGIIQSKAQDGSTYGAERLRTSLNESRNEELNPEQLMQSVIASVTSFTGRKDPDVDLVLLALEYMRGNRDQAKLLLAPDMGKVQELQAFLKEQMTMNRITGKAYAQILVCAEEMFAICCRYAADTKVEIDCTVSGQNKLVLRLIADLRGVDPFADEENTVTQNAIEFIRKNAESFELVETNRKSGLVMTKSFR